MVDTIKNLETGLTFRGTVDSILPIISEINSVENKSHYVGDIVFAEKENSFYVFDGYQFIPTSSVESYDSFEKKKEECLGTECRHCGAPVLKHTKCEYCGQWAEDKIPNLV